MVYQNIMVDIYQAASPAVGERLFDDDMLRDIYYICEEIFQKRNKRIPYPQKEVEEYFEEFHTIISFFKHVEITLDFVDLDWSGLLDELIHTFPQIAWIGGSKEKEDNRVVYYIDFVPIAYRDTGFPFMVNLLQSLDQQLIGDSDDVLESFVNEIERLVTRFIRPLKDSNPSNTISEKEAEIVEYSDEDTSTNYLVKMEEAVSRERYAKERMRLANKKLEVVIDQMERQNLARAMKTLSQSNSDENEDWDHILKVDLREYSQLLQKAKFLEQSWMMNKELVTKSEKMTISDNQLTYEREQVRSFKDSVSTNEIYLILDECKLIESRVKIKKKSWFRQPHVRIMKMDYDSILNKAAYFDLIQGENYLLEQFVLNEESIADD
ncbi:hypothetical protein BCR22_10685 [Enterococcus plantarum]|uniref:hypothetical protein n=1 Tax=Enterococcus TaxID=1350 RepID=UPI00084CF238|nr:hypothetical protein [Enterococcus plantarum]MBO0422221.1 hypothetical protein [Enterococcus plantarum]MBO0467802.1 hypothetical protein [Enterococcus plantarum]OEG18799.1 hypothetical protein BCR22_10685 [Enterococcus plantarum]